MDGAELEGVSALEVHRSIPSTNDRAREWIREGVDPVAVVVAGEQTAGRGRGGRRWVSPAEGGLWMSVVVAAHGPELDPLLPLRVGLALAQRLDAHPGTHRHAPIRLKWPNDLFSVNGKVGGILCETVRNRVVVGVGLNCRAPTVPSPYPVAGLDGADPACLVPVVTAAVLAARSLGEPRLDEMEIAEWQARDVLAGVEVEAEGGTRGTAQGVDSRGRLRLVDPQGEARAVLAGSIRPVKPESWFISGRKSCSSSST